MKLITAIIRKYQLEKVHESLVNAGITRITVGRVFGARTTKSVEGEVGDGKIFITPLEECIRIRTGERGGIAI